MSYFYLQVDRLDAETPCAFYYSLGSDAHKLTERLAARLDFYRSKGFRIIHQSHRPSYKQATREDGIKLELIVVERARPLAIGSNTDWGDVDGSTVLH